MLRREDIKQLIITHNRRLQKLREQQALYGANIDPAVLIEIEDIEAELQRLETQLTNLNESDDLPLIPPPMSPPIPPTATTQPGRSSNLYGMLAGGGMAILLLLAGVVWFFASSWPKPTPSSTSAFIPPADTPPLIVTLTPTPTPTPAYSEPQFEQLIFARAYDEQNLKPIDPSSCFVEGITEVHAIFEYKGMSNGQNWERVLFRDEIEVLRKSLQWSKGQEGPFDYKIEAGGNPLPPGQWRLELYINGKLQQQGIFRIGPGC